MMTRVIDIMDPLLKSIQELTDVKHSSVFVQVENHLAFDKIVNFIEHTMIAKNGDEVLKYDHVKRCADFLGDRWFGIRGTDASYTYLPRSQANQAYLLLAKVAIDILVNHLDFKKAFDDPYQLLLPNAEKEEQSLARRAFAEEYVVKNSSGGAGTKRLIEFILSNLKTKKDFVAALQKNVPQAMWEEFLQAVTLDDLNRFILEGKDLYTALQDKSSYSGDEIYDKALLFCFAEIYKRQREREDEISHRHALSWLSDLSRGYIVPYTREQKYRAVLLLQSFLVSDKPFHDVRDYARRNAEKEEYIGALFERFSYLGTIANQVLSLGDPDFFQKNEPGLFESLTKWSVR